MNEMPDNIEDAFSALSLSLLPQSRKDLKTDCSCPDWANPCKHIAGVYYLVASEFDNAPFLMFELRGLSKDELQQELAKSPLGKVLLSQFTTEQIKIETSESYYTKPDEQEIKDEVNLKEFWTGKKRLPQKIEAPTTSTVDAILIKKQGDFPSFWEKDVSFISVMEDFYRIVKRKNKKFW